MQLKRIWMKSKSDTALGDQTNKVFSGSFVTYGRGRYEVTAIGMNTEVGKIADLMKNTSEKRTPLQVNLDDFGKKLSILILVFSGSNIWSKCISGRIYWVQRLCLLLHWQLQRYRRLLVRL